MKKKKKKNKLNQQIVFTCSVTRDPFIQKKTQSSPLYHQSINQKNRTTYIQGNVNPELCCSLQYSVAATKYVSLIEVAV